MKGHLDVKELEGYKKAELQKLARDLGVSDEGTIKEIAERCAAVEVELPDNQEGATQDDKEAAPDNQEETTQDNQAAAIKAQPGEVIVEVVKRYADLELKRVVSKGERLPMKKDRAAVIVGKKLGKVVEE